MNFIAQILLKSLTGFLIKMLTAFASEKIFAYTLFSIMKAGAKSTKITWDDEWVARMEEAYYDIKEDESFKDKLR